MDARVKKTVKYVALPGLIPRIRHLFGSGFTNVAVYLAYLFKSIRLLPNNHPYLIPENQGRFGITHVLAAGLKNLEFKKENIDQIIIVTILLAGMVALFMQLFLFLYAVTLPSAFAGTIGDEWERFFGKSGHDPTYDIAFTLLDRVFGYPGMYGSCVDQGVPCRYDAITGTATGPADSIPNNFHIALHTFVRYYNLGILAVGMIIVVISYLPLLIF